MIVNHDSVIGFIGTYTRNESEGIYKFAFNSSSGKFEKIALACKIENPAFLAIDKEINVLYSTCKIDAKSGISSFKFWKEKDSLNLINYNLLEDIEPCHLSVYNDKQLLISSNYHENKMIIYNTLNGIILKPLEIISHSNSVNCKEKQDAPHISCSIFTRDERYIVSLDLGIDKLMVYKFENNKFIEMEDSHYCFPEGTGPSYITYAKGNNIYYVISRLTSEIFVFHYSPTKETPFTFIQKISTLPDNYDGPKSGAAMHIHKNNKFLYTSDRSNNSITLFHINTSNGKLKYINTFDCAGECPGDFKIDPSGKFLLCANENSDNISVFSINKLSGELKLVSTEHVPTPASINFL